MDIECKWVPTKKRGPKPRNKRLVETAAAEADAYSASLDSVATAAETQSLEIDIDIDNQNAPVESDLTDELLCLDKSELPNSMSESYARMLEDSSEIGVFINPLRDRSIITNSGESQERIFQRFFSDEIPEETRETVMYYFDYFYSICPIFHPAMFVRRLVEGKVESILLEAMRASAARIIMKKTGKTIDVDKLINQIYKRLILYVDRPTVDYVRTVVLMASLNGGEGNFLMYNSLTYLAVSLVTRLGWNAIDLENPEKHASSWEEW
ncbi:hypothetical protein H4S06_005825, partial [Coemansia sp. BCRC 34490]